MSADAALRFEHVTIAFPGDTGPLKVVNDVSFAVEPGKCLVIVGESGSGKSMACQALLGIVPSPGTVSGDGIFWQGRDLLKSTDREWMQVRGAEIAMVFQDPAAALNPLMPVGRQIIDIVRAHRSVTRAEAERRAVEVLNQVGFPEPEQRMRAYPIELSGGLRQRVAIAMALACSPRLIIADEATTNLDVSIQAQIIGLLRELKDELGLSIVFVTHDLGLAPEIGDEVLVLYAGHAVERGPVRTVLDRPAHPYTIGLLGSAPTLQSSRSHPLKPIAGQVPALDEIGMGAPFRSRCPVVVTGRCESAKPEWTGCGADHFVACHRFALDGFGGVQ